MDKQQQALQDLRQTISETTGFDKGERFEDRIQVREYFTVESLRSMVGTEAPDVSQDQLAEWADAVIENRWHVTGTFPLECYHCGRLFSLSGAGFDECPGCNAGYFYCPHCSLILTGEQVATLWGTHADCPKCGQSLEL